MKLSDAFKKNTPPLDAPKMSDSIMQSPNTSGSVKKDEVMEIFTQALKEGASDIHIEPGELDIHVRLRIDGHFINYRRFPLEQKSAIVARIKIMASLKIDEQRLPQDGKATFQDENGNDIDMRVSIMPNIYGEKVVIRILKKESGLLDLRSIGVLPMNMVKIRKHLDTTNGLILVV
jgi:type II secretory ATPase GspE/PulE/Tfp pilus assembly ATPase PilB-like protein